MQDKSTVAELTELFSLIETLPNESREPFERAILRAAENINRRQRIVHYVQEALVQLRLDMKYIMFDLEATRRERDELLGRK
ncbi:MAG: transcriptional regulator [Planctomycetaceae bacterium]|nr:transcriptional regulator [Planctomycetaceae bacterium]